MKNLQNRTAVVTGAGSGIGRALSVLLAKEGCRLAIADINAEGLAETERVVAALGRPVSSHKVNVADKERMQEFVEEVVAAHGGVHIVVNNAGVAVAKTFMDHSIEEFEWLMGINFWGVVYGCKFFLPHLLKADEGHIVNLSSLFGLLGVPMQSSYCSSKFAVRGLSESLRIELASSNVGITSVHPGGIATNIAASSVHKDDPESVRRHERAERAFKKMMPPATAAAAHPQRHQEEQAARADHQGGLHAGHRQASCARRPARRWWPGASSGWRASRIVQAPTDTDRAILQGSHGAGATNMKQYEVIVIGTGFSGLGMGMRLKQSGIDDFLILEKDDGVGGTWRANHYPGAACDVQSHLYSLLVRAQPALDARVRAAEGDPRVPRALHRQVWRAASHTLQHRDYQGQLRRYERVVDGCAGRGRNPAHALPRVWLWRPEQALVPRHQGARRLSGHPVPHGTLAARLRPFGQDRGGDRHRCERDPGRAGHRRPRWAS